MTGESNPNPKKQKIDSELGAEEERSVISQQSDNGTFIDEGFIFIELQGEKSVIRKLNRRFHVGDQVVLLKNKPEDKVYEGSLCTIIAVFGGVGGEQSGVGGEQSGVGGEQSLDNGLYEIQFDSYFAGDDLSRKSKKRHPDFEFPSSTYVTIVSGKDIVRLIKQDLLYKTWFA